MADNAFVALDFETANGKRTSICSVGMVKVINNQITESFYTLVNPFDYFTETNTVSYTHLTLPTIYSV